MKRIILILCFIISFVTGCVASNPVINDDSGTIIKNKKQVENKYVSYNGKLKVDGINLVNRYGKAIQLRGISSHGLQWYSNFINEENLKVLKNDWKSNVFRIAMYTDEDGYISNKNLLNTLEEKVDLVIKQDMYVIIDWHVLKDNNPMTYKEEAKEFFD